jgi:DNA-binding transcriptional LysR family regulator
MRFRSYDALKVFDVVARRLSVTAAAEELHQSKGSISYQIAKLENELGFKLFRREHPRISITDKGARLLHASQAALAQLDREIASLRETETKSVSIAMQSYVLSRWLSPRLSSFVDAHPEVALRVDPLNSLEDIGTCGADVAIMWGTDEWFGHESELLFTCPSIPTANKALANRVQEIGISEAVRELPLLIDSSGDRGWRAWHKAAGLPYNPRADSLVFVDSNSRVQAVIDGQGLALWDALVTPEVESGELVFVSDQRLENFGYHLVYPNGRPGAADCGARSFRSWLRAQAAEN